MNSSFHQGAAIVALCVLASLPSHAQSLNSNRVQSHLDTICLPENIGVRSTEGQLDEMEAYLLQELEALGYTVHTQAVSSGSRTNNNIWVELNVTGSNDVTLLMAHQDSTSGSTGCGDDGFSAAALLEYAKLLSGSTFDSGRGLILFWTQFEEADSLGSKLFVNTGHATNVDKAISLETLSWRCSTPGCEQPYVDLPDSLFGNCNSQGSVAADFDVTCGAGCTGEHIYITRDDVAGDLAAEVQAFVAPTTDVVTVAVVDGCDQRPELRRSDHQWFWDIDTPAILISSGAASRTQCYHNNGDQDDYDCPEWDFDAGIEIAQGVLDWLVADLGVTSLDALNFSVPHSESLGGPGVAPRIATADLNEDCSVDVVIPHNWETPGQAPGTIVAFNDGTGAFPNPQAFPAGNGLTDLRLVDLNDDGYLDVVVVEAFDAGGFATSYCGGNQPRAPIFLGDGDGGFTLGSCLDPNSTPSAVAAADFDEDGQIDIVIAHSRYLPDGTTAPREALFFRGNGDGTFRAGTTAFRMHATDLNVADYNDDGHWDLAVAGNSSAPILVGAGTGMFFNSGDYAVGQSRLATGDIDNDGLPEVAGLIGTNEVWVTDLDTQAVPWAAYPVGSSPVGVAIEDVDLDGFDDVVTVNAASGNVSIRRGRADGTLGAELLFAVGSEPRAVSLADVNRDGYPDLLVGDNNPLPGGDPGTGTLSVLLQAVSAPLEVSIAAAPALEVGVPFRLCLSSIGGQPGFDWSLDSGTLPAGLFLDTQHGLIYGTPTQVDPAAFSLRVEDAFGESKSAAFVWSALPNAASSPSAASDSSLGMQPMRVDGFNRQTGMLTLRYDPACSAADHLVLSGPLYDVAEQVHDLATCGLGTSGQATLDVGDGDRYWILAGRSDEAEGSAGRDSLGRERPGSTAALGCHLPRQFGTCSP